MNPVKKEPYYLAPGHMYFTVHHEVFQTVLGSCVAVCLWDSKNKWGCMNHFLYPAIHERNKATPLYGNVAMLALIKMMDESGCNRADIRAHIIGGAHIENRFPESLGDENVRMARTILKRKEIEIASEDVGGTVGRKVAFDVATGDIVVLKVQKIRSADWH
jgi:chemotaxis protein CheD